jgi:hypothetical protein
MIRGQWIYGKKGILKKEIYIFFLKSLNIFSKWTRIRAWDHHRPTQAGTGQHTGWI